MKKMMAVTSLSVCMSMCSTLGWAENNVDIKASAGLGYSSNVYHSPSSPYFDSAAGIQVTPNVQSGAFVPLGLGVGFDVSSAIRLEYLFDGQFYLDSALSNANVYDHNIKLMTTKALDSATFDAAVFLGWHTQTYFDKDTGENKLTPTSLTDISARYNYQAFGAEGKYKKEISGIQYLLDGKYAVLNYDTVLVSELDNTQLHLGGSAKLDVADGMKVKVGYKYSSQDYDKRKARDVSAALVPTLRSYTFHNFSGQLFWKPTQETKIFLDAGYTKRTDNFVGYNDYDKSLLKLRVLYTLNQDIILRGKLFYSNTDYTNAFIFEDPTLAKKTSSTTLVSLKAKYNKPILGSSSLWAKLDSKQVSANDLRYNYDLTEVSVGGDWKF